ncbi:MAG: dihydrofolate reductase family protein [Solirubrobacterales bacterium]|nr:dihydrofolate reductase family protein [Solirubrobacterales bacterium]
MSSPEPDRDPTAVTRLLPDPGPTGFEAELAEYRPFEHPHPERPWVAANMVTTLDGRASVEGNTRQLGSRADAEHFLALRTRFDAILVGAGTIRAERYGRVIRDPQLRARRERIGLPHDPLAVIVSGSLDLPWDAPIFTDGGGRILIFTREQPETRPDTATSLRIESMPGGIDPGGMLRHLRQERGIRALLCEGGPHLLGQLLEADLVDDLFLTVAPLTSGADAPRITEGGGPAVRNFELDRALLAEGDLLTRYRRVRPAS